MSKLLHDGRLLEERGRRHCALAQRFDRHIDAVAPLAVEHLTEVAASQFAQQLNLRAWYFIFVAQLRAQIPHLWLRFGAGTRQYVTQAERVFCNRVYDLKRAARPEMMSNTHCCRP